MGGGQREGTEQERILNTIFHELRNLDKLTWSHYDATDKYGNDLIEDAEWIKQKLNDFINCIKEQIKKDNVPVKESKEKEKMVKEIGYRAWIKKEKRMVECSGIKLGNCPQGFYGVYYRDVPKEENVESKGDIYLYRDDIILMQYTGLKDVNGKKIYEGDVMKPQYTFDRNFVVVYDENLCSFELRNSPDESYITSEHLYDTTGQNDLGYNFWEVLGNIHENPALLTKEEKQTVNKCCEKYLVGRKHSWNYCPKCGNRLYPPVKMEWSAN